MITRLGIPLLFVICTLIGCTSVRVGPRVGTELPAGSGGFNTVAGITAEGWYSPTGFVRLDPQVRVLHSSKHVDDGVGTLGYYSPTVDVMVNSRATVVELPIMMGFTLGDSSRLQPIFAVGGSIFARVHSTTSSIGTIESVESPDETTTYLINATRSDNTMSSINGSIFVMAGLTYVATSTMDVRTEVRTSFLPKGIPYWDPMYDYTGGSPYASFYVPEFSASIMISAVFHL
ncbi:MAG: hypothetical protein JSS89_08775 [Bacteroidetes bacterium]|nr:hypothetical protein [Bacteroidota bacterium]